MMSCNKVAIAAMMVLWALILLLSPVHADPPTTAPATATETPDAKLEHGKQTYSQATDSSKRFLLVAIDSRISAATDAGDLKLVESLQSARAVAQVDGSIPDAVKDPVILAAKTRYNQAIRIAGIRLAQAYRDSIRDYIRAGRTSDAQTTQAEMDAIGLSGVTPQAPTALASGSDVAMPEGTFGLAKNLPPMLTTNAQYSVDKDGIHLGESFIRTKKGDFLHRDFVFDLWFTTANHSTIALIGFGKGDGGDDAVFFRVHPPDLIGGGVMVAASGQSMKGIGHLSEPGEYIARIEKQGNSITMSIGEEKDGKFEASVSSTIPDIHEFAPYLNDKNMHLFFGHGFAFRQVRFSTSAPADATARVITLPGQPAVSSSPLSPVVPHVDDNNVSKAKVIDLLKMVDVAKNSLAGKWEFRNGALISTPDGHGRDRIEILYHPPAEYDYRVVFTRTSGNDCVATLCWAMEHQFSCDLGAWSNTISGISLVGGRLPDVNATGRHSKGWLENGQRYTSIVKVRKDGIQVFLDGKLITEWKTDYADMGLYEAYKLNHSNTIGLACNAPTVFYSAEIIEITGKGEPLK